MDKNISELHIGDYIYDMHYFRPNDHFREHPEFWIKEKCRITDYTSIEVKGGSSFIEQILRFQGIDKKYCNKELIIVDRRENFVPSSNQYEIENITLKTAFSYDDRRFGLLTVEVEFSEKNK